jgi:phosphatidylserine/phosphatidylglycerophosphate/cardiolipin synthase-like enzyme
VSPESAQRAASAFAVAREHLNEFAVASALRVANELRRVERLDRPEIEIVWTGPDADGPLVRPTAAVVEEMIRSVRDSGEILIVGYALTAESGTPMRLIVDLLGHAAQQNARITLVLHSDQESANRENLLKAWNVFAKKPRILTWRPMGALPYTSLHAKVMVVDRLDALVTSANFTLHGFESNLEVGLRVRGPQAGAIAERFDHLTAAGVLREWAR